MANIIRLKRRATGGALGAPATLNTTEPAYNEVDDVLYLGKGDNGAGVATSILPVGGKGAFVDLTTAQTVAGIKTFSTSPVAPTPAGGTNTTQISTTAFVIAEIAARLASSAAMIYKGAIDCSTNPNYPAANAGDTYRFSVAGKIGGASGAAVEAGDMMICFVDASPTGIQAVVGGNWDVIQVNIDGAATVTGAQTLTNKTMSGATNTFSNIPNTAVAGLGTMALQDAAAVAITGGTIDGCVLDGGTF